VRSVLSVVSFIGSNIKRILATESTEFFWSTNWANYTNLKLSNVVA